MLISHVVSETLLYPISFMTNMAFIRFVVTMKYLGVTPHITKLKNSEKYCRMFRCFLKLNSEF